MSSAPQEPLHPQAPNPVPLPDELLLAIFESLTATTHCTYDASTNILNLRLVCCQWNRVASPFVAEYSLVQVAQSERAAALPSYLALNEVRALAVGISEFQAGIITPTTFFSLLDAARDIRQLVVLCGDVRSDTPIAQTPTDQTRLQNLLDVTIMSVSALHATTIASSILLQLPNTIKFLQLPGVDIPSPQALSQTLAVQLVSLTILKYPSAMAEWVLASSRESLQSLTLGYATDIYTLPEKHPNIRSLRILERVDPLGNLYQLRRLLRLERLELRTQTFHPDITLCNMSTLLPDTITYLRFWSTEMAHSLGTALEVSLSFDKPRVLPNLRTVVWDADPHPCVRKEMALGSLQRACRDLGIKLRAYPRTGAGAKATMGHDMEYEANLRTTCFKAHPPPTGPSSLPASLKRPSAELPTRVLSDLVERDVTLSSVFTPTTSLSVVPAHLHPIFEDCFHDHAHWVSETFPKLEAEQRTRRTAAQNAWNILGRVASLGQASSGRFSFKFLTFMRMAIAINFVVLAIFINVIAAENTPVRCGGTSGAILLSGSVALFALHSLALVYL